MNTKYLTRSMLLVSVTLLSALIVSVGTRPAAGQVGLVKAYGAGIGSAQPYEPVGPYVDGISYPQFLVTQDAQWTALKSGAIDIYDFPVTKSEQSDFTSNICVAAPDAPAGIAPCAAGQAPIQHEIAETTVNVIDKRELDFQTTQFPSNVQAFRWAIAWVFDKENVTTNILGGLGTPIYTSVPCPTMCNPANGQWVDSSLLTSTAEANHVYGAGLSFGTRLATANAILDAAGFTVSAGHRVNNRVGCAGDPGGCGALLKPFFYVRSDDTERLSWGRYLETIMAAPVGSGGLGIQMDSGCTVTAYPSAQNYCETTRHALFNPVFEANNFNMYTGGWGLSRDPTFLSIYDPLGIFPGGTNYNRYNDPVFTSAERGLIFATTLSNGVAFAHAAEKEYNTSLPVLDAYSHNAPFAYRIFHQDADAALNGLAWTGINVEVGLGWNNPFSFLNAQLVGAPVHDPAHPLFIKYSIKTDLLDSPNPIDSQFVYDLETWSSSYDTLNALTNDDLAFSGDLPWMSSLPVQTNIANGAKFADGSTCVPDAPATGCAQYTETLRSDLTFAASLDGTIPAIPVTANDVAFSMLLARDSPTSFISSSYFDLQNVIVNNPHSFTAEFRTQSVFNRHFIGATPVESEQHWCAEAHMGGWPGTTSPSTDCFPIGYPAGPTVFTGSATIPPASVTSCNLDFNDFGIFQCPWPKSPQAPSDAQCTEGAGCVWADSTVSVTSSTGGSFVAGAPVGVDLGSYAFVYDSQASFANPNGPMLFRVRTNTVNTPGDGYFTNVGSSTFGLNGNGAGWYKFHQAGNVNWYCTACPGGTSESGPLPASDMVINIVDLAIVASHFSQNPGLVGPYGHAAWDLSGAAGTPDGTVNIFDLTRVAIHFGQSYLGGTDAGGGSIGAVPGWVTESIPGT